ncbi:hypothetical protein SPRG_05818 [Saprolegnia parasitica CBS 223.65]|uniref:Uncharacterized protein n=1 Tax=Saprolegnia parasitica (strain CBS 223.65) TaxID=695850 RepID=A0A067CRZ1_SAPPC|nr:hypothetical protein SPRG_05818 [Saprolegnia parasitica CBS 223.65]KDO29281.1 hypothetical protein SPRG_05818 [Saprolegnia parasitica CBS 223.65]|eukprot:XP_012199789.1 hypothetical protein SPRG_05818 [Saprolegnia parasitica CBS 223.65]
MEHQYIDKVGKSDPMKACEKGDLAEVQRLLPTALLAATMRSVHTITGLCLSRCHAAQTGQTVLHVGCIQGSVLILRALLEVVPDGNVRDKVPLRKRVEYMDA